MKTHSDLKTLRVPGVLCGIAVGIFLLPITPTSHADTDMGCKFPLYSPNPICGLLEDGKTCMKWQFSTDPSSCDGGTNEFHCYRYTVPGQLWLYSKAGTTAEECACSTDEWIADPSNPKSDSVTQAYNNDTQCYE